MHMLTWFFLFAALSVPVGFAGAEESAMPTTSEAKTTPDVDSAALAAQKAAKHSLAAYLIAEPNTDQLGQHAYRMGDTIHVKIEGNHQITVADSKAIGVRLVLDDVVMKSIGEPTTAMQDGIGTNLILAFRLSRDPENNDSRNEWKKLLEKQHNGYLMTLPIALAIGTSAALPVTPSLRFYITTTEKVYGTLGVGLVVFVLLYQWLYRNKSALRDFPDGPYSLGKSQMAFWGLLVILTFVGVWVNTGLIEHIPQQVLILLGISGATGLSALTIGEGTKMKREETKMKMAEITRLEEKLKTLKEGDSDSREPIEEQLKKLRETLTVTIKGFFQDICDDGNGMSFPRLQTVMWTVILGVIFVASVAQVISMPEFPDTLLILLGISNSIYLGFKFPEKSCAHRAKNEISGATEQKTH